MFEKLACSLARWHAKLKNWHAVWHALWHVGTIFGTLARETGTWHPFGTLARRHVGM